MAHQSVQLEEFLVVGRHNELDDREQAIKD